MNCCASRATAINLGALSDDNAESIALLKHNSSRARLRLDYCSLLMKGTYAMAVFPNDPTATIPDCIKGLIFDCDGTLVDSMLMHYLAWKEAMAAVNIQISEERFYSLAGVPTSTIVQTLAKEQNVDCDVQAAAENK